MTQFQRNIDLSNVYFLKMRPQKVTKKPVDDLCDNKKKKYESIAILISRRSPALLLLT